MGLMTDRTGDLSQVRLVGVAVLEGLGFGFLRQFIHGTVTNQALCIFDCRIGFGEFFAMTIDTGYIRLGMDIIHEFSSLVGAPHDSFWPIRPKLFPADHLWQVRQSTPPFGGRWARCILVEKALFLLAPDMSGL